MFCPGNFRSDNFRSDKDVDVRLVGDQSTILVQAYVNVPWMISGGGKFFPANFAFHYCFTSPKNVVGPDGFEPSTSVLSGQRSNQLSYGPERTCFCGSPEGNRTPI